MAEGDKLPELSDHAKFVISRLMTEVTLRLVIAELAIINRSPEEASQFIDKFRSRLNAFVASVNDKDNDVDRAWTKEMDDFIDNVFYGISFSEKAK